MVNGQKLYDLDIEVPSREQKKSNIYKAKITRVEPSLEAVFVNYGAERHGFLPFKEIAREYIDESAKDDKGKINIKAAIKVDQEIIVQVEKEERGNKGAALTTFISLAGRFLVAMPHNPKAGGVSRRIEGEDRDQVRKVLSELSMPKGMGVIVRTAGVGRSTEEMQWDLDSLAQVWGSIEKASKERSAPFLIYQESDIVVRALRDHYKSDVGEIIIDSKEFFDRAHTFMEMVMPNALNKLKLFEEKLPLFNRFQIESQIETAFSREVNLPSGGAIVIDHTEALISIDVNSARATKGSDIEATAKNTNLEAADEIARQLRIRDLGGLVVIDFIDMLKNNNQREVEQRLRNAVYEDRARVQTTRISRFGLMEMSRQRLRPSLGESSQIVCPRCTGQGTIRDTESLSLAVLRLLEEEALKDNTGRILVKIPVDCATYILNEKRTNIAELENRHKVHVVIIPDPNLETPHFDIERVRESDTHRHESNYKNSFELTTEDTTPAYNPLDDKDSKKTEQAVVQRISHSQPKPPSTPEPQEKEVSEAGFISRIISSLFGSDTKKEEEDEEAKKKQQNSNNRGRRQQRGGRRNNNRNNQNRNNRNKNNQNHNQNQNQNNQNKNKNDADSNNKNIAKNDQSKNDKSQNQNDNSKNQQSKNDDSQNKQNNAQNKPNNGESKPRNNRNRNRNRNQRKPNPNKQTEQGNNVSDKPKQDNQSPSIDQAKPPQSTENKPKQAEQKQQDNKPKPVEQQQQQPKAKQTEERKPNRKPRVQSDASVNKEQQSKPQEKPMSDPATATTAPKKDAAPVKKEQAKAVSKTETKVAQETKSSTQPNVKAEDKPKRKPRAPSKPKSETKAKAASTENKGQEKPAKTEQKKQTPPIAKKVTPSTEKKKVVNDKKPASPEKKPEPAAKKAEPVAKKPVNTETKPQVQATPPAKDKE